jgi:hypothetical protein
LESPYRKDYVEEIATAERRLAELDAERARLEWARAQPPRETKWAFVLLLLAALVLAALPLASCIAGYQYGERHQPSCPPH